MWSDIAFINGCKSVEKRIVTAINKVSIINGILGMLVFLKELKKAFESDKQSI